MMTMSNGRYMDKLELFFDWQLLKHCELELISDDDIGYYMFIVYDKDGNMLHGFHIERIKINNETK